MKDELALLQKQYARLQLLYQVSNVIHSTLDPQEALNLILTESVGLTGATSGSVALVNPTNGYLEIQASIGLPENVRALKLKYGQGLTGWVTRTGRPARVGNVKSDPRYVMVRPQAQSELAVPLRVYDEVRGVLNVDSDRLDAFSETDQDLLEEFALQVSKVIQNTWLYEQLRLKARMFEALASVGQTINSTFNLDEGLKVIAREACALMNAKLCAVHLLDETGKWLDLMACHGGGEAYTRKPRLSAGESLLGTIARRRKAIQVRNVQTSSTYQNIDVALKEGLVSLLSVPLLYREEPLGVISVYKASSYTFSNEEIKVMLALAELSAIVIEKARLYERMVDAEEQLRQNERLSSLGLLAAEVAHEIRNPLTVMKMLFHSLDLSFPDDDPRSKDARIMGEKMDHLNKIVEQILNFARNAEPKLSSVNINDLVADLTLLTRHKLRNQRIQLELHLDPDLPLIRADGMQLEQAFLNLTLNAVQAMPDGGVLSIQTQSEPHRDAASTKASAIRILFRDNGEGMSPAQCQRAFTSLLSSTKREGSGLGLALVSRVVDIHQGKIMIDSKPNHGTEIIITLPVSAPAQRQSS